MIDDLQNNFSQGMLVNVRYVVYFSLIGYFAHLLHNSKVEK